MFVLKQKANKKTTLIKEAEVINSSYGLITHSSTKYLDLLLKVMISLSDDME